MIYLLVIIVIVVIFLVLFRQSPNRPSGTHAEDARRSLKDRGY